MWHKTNKKNILFGLIFSPHLVLRNDIFSSNEHQNLKRMLIVKVTKVRYQKYGA